MTLSVQSVESYVRRRLDGAPSVAIPELCNQVGTHILAAHRWQWPVKISHTISVPQNGTRFKLPADFGEFISIYDESSSSLISFEITSPQTLASMRNDTFTDPTVFWGSIVYIDGAPHMEFWPRAGATLQLKLTYRAEWLPVESIIPIPVWLETLFLQMVAAFAQGHDEHDIASLEQRLAEIQMGPLWNAATTKDGSVRPTVSRWSGGAMQIDYGPVAIGIATRLQGPTQPN